MAWRCERLRADRFSIASRTQENLRRCIEKTPQPEAAHDGRWWRAEKLPGSDHGWAVIEPKAAQMLGSRHQKTLSLALGDGICAVTHMLRE
jgi:hypothetical protein